MYRSQQIQRKTAHNQTLQKDSLNQNCLQNRLAVSGNNFLNQNTQLLQSAFLKTAFLPEEKMRHKEKQPHRQQFFLSCTKQFFSPLLLPPIIQGFLQKTFKFLLFFHKVFIQQQKFFAVLFFSEKRSDFFKQDIKRRKSAVCGRAF